MRLLLDTCVALWFWTADKRLPPNIVGVIEDEANDVAFHQASSWEIQIKYQLGRLKLPERPQAFIPEAVARSGFEYHRIEDEAIYLLPKLPAIHADPFDRLLASHAIHHGLTIVSRDEDLLRYPVSTLAV
jgi:PIN domain nuclease of toxin-antitoxin system